MKKVVLLAGLSLVGACSTFKAEPIHVNPYTVGYYGARNDTNPSASGMPYWVTSYNDQPSEEPYESVFPLTHAAKCDPNRTACKHAVIATGLIYSMHEVGGKVEVSGVLKSQMGRSITQVAPTPEGSHTSISSSLSEEYDLIGTGAFDTPFSFIYSPGKRVVIDGLEGVKVIIAFDPDGGTDKSQF